MKLFISFLLILIASNCTSEKKDNYEKDTKTDKTKESGLLPVMQEIITDSNITNTSRKKVYILYNSIENHFQKSDSTFHFTTECMICEPVHVYKGHLLYANQLEMSDSTISYSLKDILISDKELPLKRINCYSDRKSRNFKFSGGEGEIRYIKPSCNDADINNITLTYQSGKIKINNLLNTEFFEYDLDKDGNNEQFIISTRNCSQELAIIRIK